MSKRNPERPWATGVLILAARAVQKIHHELHLSYADDREGL